MISSVSIAVLPFVNMSKEVENEYFSDGITEEIINALTTIEGLKVIARTSSFAYKGVNEDIRQIGNKLGVSSILEGSVRKSNNRVRITAQLIDVEDGSHFWSRNFDRELIDIFSLQDEVSLLIANEVRNNFGHFEIKESLINKSTTNIQAYDLYLQGRHYQLQWNPESLKKAIAHYDQAIEKDPNYAKAYYSNLQCYGLLGIWGYMPYEECMKMAGMNFLKAKELDTSLPEYPLSFVGRSLWGEWDFGSAYKYIKQVLNINPNHIDGLEAMAELFLALGFMEYAHEYVDRLIDLDPLSANHHYTKANVFFHEERYSEAMLSLASALSIRPEFKIANHLNVLCLIGIGDEARLLDKIKDMNESILISKLYKLMHSIDVELDPSEVEVWKKADEDQSQLVPYELFILANSKYKTEAMILLKSYVFKRRGQVMNFRFSPFLKSLHNTSGFDEIHTSSLSIEDVEKNTVTSNLSKSILDKEDQEKLKTALLSYINYERPYLNPDLSLGHVANQLEISTNKLSFLVNETIGTNFNVFINSFRLEYFKKIAVLSENKHITLLGMAYESGFNSKSVFNTFFKKSEGMTPRQWLKLQ